MDAPTSCHAFVSAIQQGDLDSLRAQIDAGQDPDMDGDWHRHCCVRPLALAMQSRRLDVARLLIERGASVMDGFGGELQASSPMTSAIMAAFPEGVKLLLDSGHPLTETSLMLAVTSRRTARS